MRSNNTRRYIYKITLIPTGKIYIGKTRNPGYRFLCHRYELESGTHHNVLLQNDFNNIGTDLKMEILDEYDTTDHESNNRELQWILKCKSYDDAIGYNGNDPCIRNTKTHKYTMRMRDYLKSIGETGETGETDMPKVKAYSCEEKRRNRWSVVESWRTKQGYKFEDVGKLWDCAKSTVSMRKKHPEYMTILEIESMNLTDEQIVALVRGK